MTYVAYLQFGEWGGPYQTVKADAVQVDLEPPVSRNSSGYGSKLPTTYRVLYEKQWRRVYCCNYGNSGTTYVMVLGVEVVVNIQQEDV